MLNLDLLSVFGLRNLDTFLVLKPITDVVTINYPDMVDNILPSLPHLICILFLAIVEDILYQGTVQLLVIIVYIIYMTVVAIAYPTASSATLSAAPSSPSLFASSTHDSLEV